MAYHRAAAAKPVEDVGNGEASNRLPPNKHAEKHRGNRSFASLIPFLLPPTPSKEKGYGHRKILKFYKREYVVLLYQIFSKILAGAPPNLSSFRYIYKRLRVERVNNGQEDTVSVLGSRE